ncbi:MAG: hypothetical protein KGZ46_00320, partial [Hydrogenophaga sp.]|nr:hypothetical protein [Hydrogenophaga sp.]
QETSLLSTSSSTKNWIPFAFFKEAFHRGVSYAVFPFKFERNRIFSKHVVGTRFINHIHPSDPPTRVVSQIKATYLQNNQ